MGGEVGSKVYKDDDYELRTFGGHLLLTDSADKAIAYRGVFPLGQELPVDNPNFEDDIVGSLVHDMRSAFEARDVSRLLLECFARGGATLTTS